MAHREITEGLEDEEETLKQSVHRIKKGLIKAGIRREKTLKGGWYFLAPTSATIEDILTKFRKRFKQYPSSFRFLTDKKRYALVVLELEEED